MEAVKDLFNWPDPDKKARKLVDDIHEISRDMVRNGISAPIRVEKEGIIVTGDSGSAGIKNLTIHYEASSKSDI